MRRSLLIVVAVLVVALVVMLARQRNAPPEVPFVKAVREEIVSTLSTNGKVEPLEWAEAHAEAGGAVEQVFVSKGQSVAAGAPLVRLDARAAQSELASAEARIAQVQAELQTLKQGGRSVDVSTIEGSIASARQELSVAQRDQASLERLQSKGAATAEDVRMARDRVERAQLQIQSLQSRQTSLVNRQDIAGVEARLREAEASASAARTRIGMATINSPVAGVIYQFDLRKGSYVNPGDLVASVGKLDRVRVLVYVDEPDLGRVGVGKPVSITWDALAGRTWKGVVDKMPTQVSALGARQVGEVSSVIENPDHDLLPGTNVNVEVRSEAVQGAVVVPTAAIRRDNGKTGVFLLQGPTIVWRDVKLGVSSASRTQVSGIGEGDSVAMPSERVLKGGMAVAAVYQ